MPSALVDLSSGYYSVIDRVKPPILQYHMQDCEWISFCDCVDEALTPVNRAGRIANGSFGATFLVFLLLVVFMVKSPGTSPTPALFAIPIAMILFTFVSFCYAGTVASRVQVEIQQLCTEISDKHPQLSFHVHYKRYKCCSHGESDATTNTYIEVSVIEINNGVVDNQHYDSSGAEIPMGNAVTVAATSTSTSPAERLAELDMMKPQFSQEEYDQRQHDIMFTAESQDLQCA